MVMVKAFAVAHGGGDREADGDGYDNIAGFDDSDGDGGGDGNSQSQLFNSFPLQWWPWWR